ncbi:hypothetical protein H5410_038562 [Solanum commersonii]|uniref:Uncharacterized protein n=1 Tax=Solanum commersonii TaxID=4109 RepID=A0A9J5YB17_SOLCO|nr:hypothetical protein H5410_038562 [Solanum commersonii]
MSVVVKVLEGLVSVETNLDFNFTDLTEVGRSTNRWKSPSVQYCLQFYLDQGVALCNNNC